MTENETLLANSLGVFIAQNFYLNYISICSTMDMLSGDNCEVDFILDQLKSYQDIINTAHNKCQDLIDFNILSNEDEIFIGEVISIYNFLSQQTLAGVEYIKSNGDMELMELYENNRKRAWEKIEKLFFYT